MARGRKRTAGDAGGKEENKSASCTDIEDLTNWDEATLQQLRGSLLGWYDVSHRVLPWRRNPHSKLPEKQQAGGASHDIAQQTFIYWVWVCEVMSQQTQIERVRDYWTRWTAKWPTVADLAQASEEDVNQMWAGLGYYRRARYLLEGARAVRERFGGKFPTTSEELQKIPGIGAYTGAAIASIACGQRVAVMDANVIRVVSRLFTVDGAPTSREVQVKLNRLAAMMLDPARPGDFNQAMMEIGAVVCLGNGGEPRCGECPLADHCGAYGQLRRYLDRGGHKGDDDAPLVTSYPTKVEKAAKREEHVAVWVVQATATSEATAVEADDGEQQQQAAAPAKRRKASGRGAPRRPPGDVEGEEEGGSGGGGGVDSVGSGGGGDGGSMMMLLTKRPKDGLLAGLWEFPSVSVPADASQEERETALDQHLSRRLGLRLSHGGAAALPASSDGGTDCSGAGAGEGGKGPGQEEADKEGNGQEERSEESNEQEEEGGEGRGRQRKAGGGGGAPRVVVVRESLDAGQVVHVFSHIRMTLHVRWVAVEGMLDFRAVEEGAVAAAAGQVEEGEGEEGAPREEEGRRPATQWVRLSDIQSGSFKLTSAPAKVLKAALAAAAAAAAGGGGGKRKAPAAGMKREAAGSKAKGGGGRQAAAVEKACGGGRPITSFFKPLPKS